MVINMDDSPLLRVKRVGGVKGILYADVEYRD
jgi:hypothetical protein